MKKIFNSALFLGLALGLNSAVFAQDNNSQNPTPNAQEKTGRKIRTGKRPEGTRGGHGKNGMLGGLNRLNLTDAQKQQIENLRRNTKLNQATHNEMRDLIQAQRSGGTLTSDQQARLNTLREQAKANAEKMHQQILAILTLEQRLQLEQNKQGRNDAMVEKPQENRGQGRERRNDEVRGALQGINLTDAQKEQLRQLRTNNNSNDATRRQELRELSQARRNGTLTTEQQNRLKTLRQQIKADDEKSQQQILSILTPEQRQQLEQNKAQRKNIGRRNLR